jgi:hypothetical protein
MRWLIRLKTAAHASATKACGNEPPSAALKPRLTRGAPPAQGAIDDHRSRPRFLLMGDGRAATGHIEQNRCAPEYRYLMFFRCEQGLCCSKGSAKGSMRFYVHLSLSGIRNP